MTTLFHHDLAEARRVGYLAVPAYEPLRYDFGPGHAWLPRYYCDGRDYVQRQWRAWTGARTMPAVIARPLVDGKVEIGVTLPHWHVFDASMVPVLLRVLRAVATEPVALGYYSLAVVVASADADVAGQLLDIAYDAMVYVDDVPEPPLPVPPVPILPTFEPGEKVRRARAYLNYIDPLGVGQGRISRAYNVASWLCRNLRLPADSVGKWLQAWNQRNLDPLPKLDGILADAVMGTRSGCGAPAMRE